MPEAQGVLGAVARVVAIFESLGVPYVVGGSFASGVWGRPRQTNDLDVEVILDAARLDNVLSRLTNAFELSEQEAHAALASEDPYRGFQLLDLETLFRVDVFLSDGSDFARSCFDRALRVDLGSGTQAMVRSPEDTLLHKLAWYELGRRVSDRQWNDAAAIVETQGPRLDWAYLAAWALRLGVHESLDTLRAEVAG